MSIKIYDAWRFDGAGVDILRMGAELQQLATAQRLQLEIEDVEQTAVKIADDYWLDVNSGAEVEAPSTSLWMRVYYQREDEQRKLNAPYDPSKFEVVFLPDPDSTWVAVKGFFLGSQYRNLVETFAAEHGWQEYEYWDNTDQPDELSDDEWRERLVFWERVTAPDDNYTRGLSCQAAPVRARHVAAHFDRDTTAKPSVRGRLNGLVLKTARVSEGAEPTRWIFDFMAELSRVEYDDELLAKLEPEVHIGKGWLEHPSHSVTEKDLEKVLQGLYKVLKV